MYKEYDSDILKQIRERVEKLHQAFWVPLEPDADLARIVFGSRLEIPGGNGWMLELDGVPVGYAAGAMGTEHDSVYAYQLIAFPGAEVDYEIIAYRYNRDQFFLFRNARPIGYLKGAFAASPAEITEWNFMLNERCFGTVAVNAAMLRDERLALCFADAREPIFFRLAPPPCYTDFRGALKYWLERMTLLPRSPGHDTVISDYPAQASAVEREVIFAAFVF
ncbi:MAG: hypothetical protein PHQ27_06460, partial [Victivallales bacterium]|nr:hypothetical protein [Victivallales bacterium]